MTMKKSILFLLTGMLVAGTGDCLAGGELLNADFSQGTGNKIPGWRLPDGQSEWRAEGGGGQSGVLLLKGGAEGRGSTMCRSEPIKFSALSVYGLRFKARAEKASGGTVTSGSDFVNVDIGLPGQEWREFSYCFAAPRDVSGDHYIKFGLWECRGDFFFDDAELFEVEPVYNQAHGVTLGSGEMIEGGNYSYTSSFGGTGRNHSRALIGATAHFNTDRWALGEGSTIDYLHELAGRKFLDASLEVDCGYYQSGGLDLLASVDGANWSTLGTLSATGTLNFSVPAKLLPAERLYLRLIGQKGECNLQVHGYRLNAKVDGGLIQMQGRTRYVEQVRRPNALAVVVESLQFDDEKQSGVVTLKVENKSGATLAQSVKLVVVNQALQKRQEFSQSLTLASGGAASVKIPFELPASGEWQMEISIADLYTSRTTFIVPFFYESSYGELLPCADADVRLWQASSGWKIPRGRRLPVQQSNGMSIQLAANESEAAQLVVNPNRDLKGVVLSATSLKCGDLALPPSAVTIDQVGYVPIKQPTDATGVIADWPDPLLPQQGGTMLKKGMNHPYWIRVRVPRGVAAGIYKGAVEVVADGFQQRVPLSVEVFDFELPDRMTCETAFGMSHHRILRHHRVSSPEQRREVMDKYLQCLSDYHISPYNPAPLDPWRVTFKGLPLWRGGIAVSDTAAKGERSYKIVDDSLERNISAVYAKEVKLTGKPLKLRFAHKSSVVQPVLFTINYLRGDGSWISGNNRDIVVEGSTEWKQEEIIVETFPQEGTDFRLTLWGAGYYEDQQTTGTTWFDDIVITELESGKVIFNDGDFEELQVGELDVAFEWEAWDRAMAKAFDYYHFNSFSCPIEGLGGGTFMARHEPELAGFQEGQPGYSILMEKYLAGVQQHLAEKGWLKYAYVYWFDEPEPKDYEFVANGFKKLKKFAPRLRRMLTEQVEPELIDAPDLWCPLTPSLNVEGTEGRRQAGDQFWWYVCCVPKAPYVTLFIDHPGVEMRLWLWQTWAERVSGILVWETVYWHSDCAYPDTLQNPYEDAMGWVDHESQKGRLPWGNGDGRFVYPPPSLYTGDATQPVTDSPVPSVRLEMLRDGLEDYEYFVILKKLLEEKGTKLDAAHRKNATALLTVPESVSRSLTEFSTDPAAMQTHREKLARAIEALRKH